MVQMLAAEARGSEAGAPERDLSTLECVLIGGAPITDATAQRRPRGLSVT